MKYLKMHITNGFFNKINNNNPVPNHIGTGFFLSLYLNS